MSGEGNRQEAAGTPSWKAATSLRDALAQAADFIGAAKTLDHVQRNLANGDRCIYHIEIYRDRQTGAAHLRLLVTSSSTVLVRRDLAWDTPPAASGARNKDRGANDARTLSTPAQETDS